MIDSTLPGADLVEKGISDLSRGIESAEALLVSIGAPRLRSRAGIDPKSFRRAVEEAISGRKQ